MSKSKNNGIDPQDLIDRYGADTARLFVMFASPPEQTLEWSDTGVEGAHRFLRRVWSFCHARAEAIAAGAADAAGVDWAAQGEDSRALRREVHAILRQADYDYQRRQYNTVVSAAMKMLNALEAAAERASPDALREGASVLLRVLYPVVPHLAHALWVELGFARRHGEILDAPWPEVDEAALRQDVVELVLQVNGKVRGALKVPADSDRAAIEAAAVAHEAVRRHAEGRAARKVVVVPGRLVNVVV